MNSQMTSSEIESVIFKRLPTDKNPGSDGFTGELYQIFKQLMLLLLKLLQVWDEGVFQNSVCEAHITLIQKQKTMKKKIQASITEDGFKNPQ